MRSMHLTTLSRDYETGQYTYDDARYAPLQDQAFEAEIDRAGDRIISKLHKVDFDGLISVVWMHFTTNTHLVYRLIADDEETLYEGNDESKAAQAFFVSAGNWATY